MNYRFEVGFLAGLSTRIWPETKIASGGPVCNELNGEKWHE